MAGNIYDANKSLNWIIDDPNMKEVFRNSSIIGSRIMSSSNGSRKSAKSRKSLNKRKSEGSLSQKKKDSKNNRSNTSLANLFSNDEERDLLGIGFFTVWKAGVVVAGHGGTGIVLSRNVMTGDWSGPVAVGIYGVGAGLLLGASVKRIVYLIYDYFTLKSIVTDGGLIFGFGAAATVGTCSKETGQKSAYITSREALRSAGLGSNITLCKGLGGLYIAVSIEAGICKSRDKVNARFYGRDNLTGSDILLSGENIEIPNVITVGETTVSNFQAKRMMEKLHAKLRRLCCRDGSTHFQPDDGEARATLEMLYSQDECYDEEDEKIDEKQGEKTDSSLPLATMEIATPTLTKAEGQEKDEIDEIDTDEIEDEPSNHSID